MPSFASGPDSGSVPFREVLAVRSASLRRGGVTILDDVDFVVEQGERWALLGPNGAGKSSLLSLCGALVHPSSGTVDVLGRRLGRVDIRELRESIGHVDPRHAVRSPLTCGRSSTPA